jgi:hypothetical protein
MQGIYIYIDMFLKTVYSITKHFVVVEDDCLLGCCAIITAITLIMEAASTSETSVNFYQTVWRNIPEDSHLHTYSRENLKSRHFCVVINNPAGKGFEARTGDLLL